MTRANWIILFFYLFNYAQTAALPDQSQIFVEPNDDLTCPTTDYSEYTIHASFFSQASMIIIYGGIIFNIAIYGVKSSFSSRTTFLLDDITIFAISFIPTISWYFIAKPLYLLKFDQFRTLILVGVIFLILFSFVVYLLVLYNWPCHKGKFWNKQRKFFFTNRSLRWIRCFVIHTYLIHSILIIFYDSFSAPILFKQYHPIAFIDFQFLNFLTDILYFCLSSFLVFEFHHKKSLVHKRIFFFTVFLSTIQILFEYALVCSPPYIDTIFTFVLTTILTRSVASYFSKDQETANIYGTNITLIYGKNEEDETNPVTYHGIKLIFYLGNDVKELELYGAKVTLANKLNPTTDDITADERALKTTLVYEINEGVTKKSELDITGKTIKFNIIDGFGFIHYVIYAHRKFFVSPLAEINSYN